MQQTEARLRQSQKMEAVGQLTGGIAHDFNNLLTAINASLQLLGLRIGRGQFTGVERYVNAAEGAVKRAAALTGRLLAFARQQPLDPIPTALCDVTEEIGELISRATGSRCELDVTCALDLWNVLIDRNQMESALLNLCINARDAMPEGGVIWIRLENQPADSKVWQRLGLPEGDYVAAHVTDTGTGMSAEIAARAFDPFFTTKPQGQGTGLGLSMIYGFATQSGGLAAIDSTPGVGTTVSIYLPRFDGQHVPTAQAGEQSEPVAARNASPATILVVDDEEAIRMLLAEVLEEAGYRVLEAYDASGAVTMLESNARLNVLITDIALPGGMDGHRLAALARQKRDKLRIVMISGHGELAKEEQAGREIHFLQKPFLMDELTAKVRACWPNRYEGGRPRVRTKRSFLGLHRQGMRVEGALHRAKLMQHAEADPLHAPAAVCQPGRQRNVHAVDIVVAIGREGVFLAQGQTVGTGHATQENLTVFQPGKSDTESRVQSDRSASSDIMRTP